MNVTTKQVANVLGRILDEDTRALLSKKLVDNDLDGELKLVADAIYEAMGSAEAQA